MREVEKIPENPSSEIILNIEEIPLLNVFYSPKHRVLVKRQRKKRKIYQVLATISQDEYRNVIWKDSEVDPFKDFSKLSQFAGAYTVATIDKETKVNKLIKEKYQKIKQLEDQLKAEKQWINQ